MGLPMAPAAMMAIVGGAIEDGGEDEDVGARWR